MKNIKISKLISVLLVISIILSIISIPSVSAVETGTSKVNLSTLTYTTDEGESSLKKYTQDDFEQFVSDYKAGTLPEVYVTEFLFDGVSMVKTYDLDDFVEQGNSAEVEVLDITVININKMGSIELSGEIKGAMIAVDTNNKTGEINLILNGVNINTDSKKAPAILVYNKDITYTGCKVTIKTAEGSKNYIEGGKLKKVSLIGKDELENYTDKYSGDNKTNYTSYTNYYGVYTSEEVNSILFAKVQAGSEDLMDGDPYYFYKAAGAISSDIDLYFEGTGYLEVKSKNKEGIETKGNLTFSGGTGDYVVYAEDDCLNTTTKSSSNKSARNALTIDVNSLVAIVDAGGDSDEGDAIDSNGTLIINGGTIIAIAHPGQDAGLDSENGTYINGGTVIATGDMYDPISNESKQNYVVLSFQSAQTADTLISLLDEKNDVVMAYKTDRRYTNLVYSSPDLVEGTYYLYKDGEIQGTETYGFYTDVTDFKNGKMQGYSSTGSMQGMMNGGGMRGMDRNMEGENFSPDNNAGDNSAENAMPMDRNMPFGEMPDDSNMPEDMQNRMMENGANGMNMDRKKDIINNSEAKATRGNNNTVVNGTNENSGTDEMPEIPENAGTVTNAAPQIPEDVGTGTNGLPQMPEDTEQGDFAQGRTPSSEDGNMMGRRNQTQNTNASASNNKFEITGISNQFSGIGDYVEASTDSSTDETANSEQLEGNSNNKVDTTSQVTVIGIGVGIVAVVTILVIFVVKRKKKA